MKKLVLLILTIICTNMVSTCSSPLGIQGNLPSGTFKSKAIIPNTTNAVVLCVQISNYTIKIGLWTNTNFINGSDDVSFDEATGFYPTVNFQTGVMSGTLTYLDDSEIKISFQINDSPYFKMWDVICSTNN